MFLVSSHYCIAQQDSILVALKLQITEDSIKFYGPKRISFDFQLDNRNSFIQNKAISIQGFNPAIVVHGKFRYGLGLYSVIEPYKQYKSTKKSSVSANNTTTNRELDLYFATPNFRYIFIHRRHIQIGAELAFGFGTIDYTIKNEANTKVLSTKKGVFVPSGAGVELILIPFKWFGLSSSIGYRKSLGTYDINADFDGMYYSYGVKVFLGRIYKDLKFNKLKKRYTEAVVRANSVPH